MVYRIAELIRQRSRFQEVIESFWKEEPSLRQALRITASTDVTVVPMFLAAGYFTETVIPRELGLGHQGPVPAEGIARVIGGKSVRYMPPYGTHPRMSEVILARAREAMPEFGPQRTALVLLGHALARQHSQRVLEQHAATLRAGGLSEVQVLYLDDEASSGAWLEGIAASTVVIVPFFSAEGEHTLASEVGLAEANPTHLSTRSGPKTVYYAKPVGTHDLVAGVIMALAQEAITGDGFSGDADRSHLAAWTAFMQLARQGVRIGEASITPIGSLFEVRNALDEGKPSSELTTYVTPEGLRDAIRQDDAGQHRPVRTLRTLPRGWRAVFSEDDLPRAVHNLYPAAVEEAYACGCHTLRSTPWATTARRQTGIYAKVQKATPVQMQQVARHTCSACLRSRLWAGEPLASTFLTGVPGGIPCTEACTYLIAEVRDHMSDRRSED